MLLNELFSIVVDPGIKIIDIGAFTGETTTVFSELTGKSGRVYSFEPNPIHFLELSAKGRELGNVFPYCKAVAEEVGHRPLFLAPHHSERSSSIMPELGTESHLGPGVRSCLVETETVDNFCRTACVAPTFLKIDVEGAERLVIAGAERVVSELAPILVFEGAFGYSKQHGSHTFGEPVPSHLVWLQRLGYEFFVIDIDYLGDRWVDSSSFAHATRYQLLGTAPDDFASLPLIGVNLLAVNRRNSDLVDRMRHMASAGLIDYLAKHGITGNR